MQHVGRLMVMGGAARAVGMCAHMAAGFLMMPFLVGSLGDRWYGLYVASTSLIANLYLLDLGFATATTRQIAAGLSRDDADEINRVVNTSLWIYLALGAVVFASSVAIAWAAAWFISDATSLATAQTVLLLTGGNLALSFPFKAFAGIVHSRLRYDLLVITQLTTLGITVAGNVWVVKSGYGIVGLATVALAAGQFSNVAFAVLAKHLFPPLRLAVRQFDRTQGSDLARYSAWAFLAQIGNQLRFRVDALTVGGLFGASAVTTYSIGARLAEYSHSPLLQVSNTAMPALTRFHVAQDAKRTSDAVLFLLKIHALLCFYVGGLLILLGRPFIALWMGDGYEASYFVACTLTVALMSDILLLPLTNWLYAAAGHKTLAIANLTEAAANVALSIVLGSFFGLIGVALGTLIPLLVVQFLWVAPRACRSLGLRPGGLLSIVATATIACVMVAVSGSVVRATLEIRGLLDLVVAATAATLIYWPLALCLALAAGDRARLLAALPLPSLRVVDARVQRLWLRAGGRL